MHGEKCKLLISCNPRNAMNSARTWRVSALQVTRRYVRRYRRGVSALHDDSHDNSQDQEARQRTQESELDRSVMEFAYLDK